MKKYKTSHDPKEKRRTSLDPEKILRIRLFELFTQITISCESSRVTMPKQANLALVFKSIKGVVISYWAYSINNCGSQNFFKITPEEMARFPPTPNDWISFEDRQQILRVRSHQYLYYAFYVAVIQDGNITMSSIHPNFATLGDGMLDGDGILQELFPPDPPVDFDDFGYPDISQVQSGDGDEYDEGDYLSLDF